MRGLLQQIRETSDSLTRTYEVTREAPGRLGELIDQTLGSKLSEAVQYRYEAERGGYLKNGGQLVHEGHTEKVDFCY
jgi:hypothetical protein